MYITISTRKPGYVPSYISDLRVLPEGKRLLARGWSDNLCIKVSCVQLAFIIAAVIEWSLPFLPHPEQYGFKILQAFIGTLMVGFASGIYLIANLGPGPRDGLMTGFQRVTGFPIAWVRASIEIVVVAIGWTLGGSIGLATILFAFGIGPAVSVGLFCISAMAKK